ncbi:AMSH-like ubiquitin thioesterase 3 [Citrus sinensis]|nr:AMSH-like ubiquitin thioesterase 3 [Citrus sinensis]
MKINVDSIARKIDVDNRIPLRYYYRIADNLLKQASIYREEKNIVDLYIILLRYSSLVSETIPFHRDYQVLLAKERAVYRKRLIAVLDELEALKPEFQRRLKELNRTNGESELIKFDGSDRTSNGAETSSSEWPVSNKKLNLRVDSKQPSSMEIQSSWRNSTQVSSSSSSQIDKQFQKLSVNIPLPKKETLSRHSFLGPHGLRGQWLGPSAEIKVHYPSSTDLTTTEDISLNQAGQYGIVPIKDGDPGGAISTMESVLSLDDGRWLHPAEKSCPPMVHEAREDPFQFVSTKQPSPPPVLAQVQQASIPPSRVADPRPGPAQDISLNTNEYQHLHVPVNMMQDFLRLAQANTEKNLETCGVLAGSLTHPSQTCFMSSVDLHTHYSYQIMLPEAVAIVMAPTDTSSPHGIFHLSDPGGVSVIRNCQQRGFHPHEEPEDGSPLYEHCSHVFMNAKLQFDVVDLR